MIPRIVSCILVHIISRMMSRIIFRILSRMISHMLFRGLRRTTRRHAFVRECVRAQTCIQMIFRLFGCFVSKWFFNYLSIV